MKEMKYIEIEPELVQRAQNGDSAAFTELYQKSGPIIYRTVYSMVRDEDLAWDVHQNAYLLAWQNLSDLGNPQLFLPWLRKIAVREAIRELKKDQPLCFSELANEEDEEPQFVESREDYQPELQIDKQEAARLVREILDQMPQKQKLIVGMYYYEQYSIKEIAETLNITQGTVKTQLHLGRKRVEAEVRRLEKQGVKLYGLSPMAFLGGLLKRMPLPAREPAYALAKTLTKAGAAAGAKAASSAAAPVVLHATKPFFSTVIGKVVLGVVAAGVVVGGAAGYRWAKNNLFTKTGNILMVDTGENLRNDPTAPTLPVELDVTGPTLPIERDDTSEDLVSGPAVTEPAATEPAETEPTQPSSADIECGENLTWDFDPEEGKLTITGSGTMYDYAAEEDAPWHRFRSEIHSVELPEGLTVIGKNTFAHCSMGEILIPDGVTVIGESAFSGCENLRIVNIPEGVTRIGDAAFLDCQSLNTSCSYAGGIKSKVDPACTLIFIPDSVEEIGARAFGYFDNPYKSFSIFGSENSAAERYAEENGLTFEPIVVVDEASIVAQLQKDQGVLGAEARLSYYKTVGDRCLAKVVHLDPITLTEEEIQAAKHNGVLTVDGKDYPFTDSWEEASEMGFIQELSEQDPEPAGWISVDTGAKQPFMTPILHRDDGCYVIRDYDRADMYWTDHSFTSLGWIWLGIENVQSFQLEYAQKFGLARFLDTVDFQGVYHILELDGDGNIVISSRGGM